VAQVVDASIAIAWCAPTQATSFTRAALKAVIEDGGHVPAQFWFEVLYSVARLERRGIIARVEADEFVRLLSTLPITIAAALSSSDMVRLHAIARHYGLKIYDAAYLELALRTDWPLATRDDLLADAARQAGATLFAP
jgi:predicted nucleic acid-binding protein